MARPGTSASPLRAASQVHPQPAVSLHLQGRPLRETETEELRIKAPSMGSGQVDLCVSYFAVCDPLDL